MNFTSSEQRFDTVVIGGGQAGLAIGYYLARQGRDFVILDANARSGASWRKRWDSLRLFTPARYSSLPGMPFPASADTFLPKDQVADYLEAYAARFHLPVRLDAVVETLTRKADRYLLTMGDHRLEAEHIVVATGNQHPITPAFASLLDPTITQFHSTEYRHPNQLQQGDVLLVGAGNSGAEIALELAQTRRTWLADRDTGHSPKPAETPIIGPLYWWLIHQALTTDNKTGRRFKELSGKKGAPLVGISKKAFERAGVERAPRMVGVQDGKPALQDGRVLSLGKRDLVYGVYS